MYPSSAEVEAEAEDGKVRRWNNQEEHQTSNNKHQIFAFAVPIPAEAGKTHQMHQMHQMHQRWGRNSESRDEKAHDVVLGGEKEENPGP